MVVEHEFVTIYDWQDVRPVAIDLLSRHGFIASDDATDPTPTASLAMSRPVKVYNEFGRAMAPMEARLQFDRGRVTMGVSMQDVAGRRSFGLFYTGALSPRLQTEREEYLIGLANALESALTGALPIGDAAEPVAQMEQAFRNEQRQRVRARRIVLGTIGTFVLAVIVFVILMK